MTAPLILFLHVSGDAALLSDLNADVMDQRAAIVSALAFAARAV